ncbi:MAG: hypothetical protein WCV90_04250 [Candidatus Woesearchaeota archaeon]
MEFVHELNGKKITIQILFTDYSLELFNLDADIFHKFNTMEWHSHKDAPKKIRSYVRMLRDYEVFFRSDIYKAIKKGIKPKIDYKEYQQFIGKQISRLILVILTDNPSIIPQKELTIRIEVYDKKVDGCLGGLDWSASSKYLVSLTFNGTALLSRIYLPWVYTQHFDAAFWLKALDHELEHQTAVIRELYLKQEQKQNHFAKKIARGKMRASFYEIYEVLCGIQTEGTAVFRDWQNRVYVDFNLPQIQKLKALLIAASKLETREEAEALLEKKFHPKGETGEYYLGYLMCYFIGLSKLKKKRKTDPSLNVYVTKPGRIEFSDLNKFLFESKVVRLEPLDPLTFKETYATLSAIKDHKKFILTYLAACKELKLKDSVRFFDMDFYNLLLENAKK